MIYIIITVVNKITKLILIKLKSLSTQPFLRISNIFNTTARLLISLYYYTDACILYTNTNNYNCVFVHFFIWTFFLFLENWRFLALSNLQGLKNSPQPL